MSAPSRSAGEPAGRSKPTLEDAKQPSTESPMPRAAGILLHPTSLPGPHGIGDLGAAAYRFVEMLEAARQTIWQMMPLGPVGLGNSPYAASSAFAGFPLLIALDQLAGRGWLDAERPGGTRLPAGAGPVRGRRRVQDWRGCGRRSSASSSGASAEDRAVAGGVPGAAAGPGWTTTPCSWRSRTRTAGAGWMDWDRPLALREAGRPGEGPPGAGGGRPVPPVGPVGLLRAVGLGAEVRQRSRHHDRRRHPDLRRLGQRRRLGPSRAVPDGRRAAEGRGRGAA